jgi:polysaccharide biosynthesis/export protein
MKKTPLSLTLLASSVVLLAGCSSITPGSYQPRSNPAVAGGPYTDEVLKGIQVVPINGALIASQKEPVVAAAASPADPWVYRIGPQDIVRITVWGHPDLSASVSIETSQGSDVLARSITGRVVDENGDIFIALIGRIRAAGLSIPEFRTKLTQELAKYIQKPQVEIDISAFRSQWVVISGKAQSKIAITDVPMRLSDALAKAGATGDGVGLEDVTVTRGNQRIPVDMYRVLYQGDQRRDMMLRHGDLVTVPDRQSRKVFIAGEIGKGARSQVMRLGGTTLTEVLMDAGGPNLMTSRLDGLFVIRDRGDGVPVIYQMDAKDPVSMVMADSFRLKPRDIVYINPTDLALVGRTLAQFFPALSGISALDTFNTNVIRGQ